MKWQPIETAPKDGTDVLVYARGSYAVACWNGEEWRDMGDIGWAGMYGDDNQPTHWLPLPHPPFNEGCKKRLAPGQWWAYCGETDMGQSLPALCTECGGTFALRNAGIPEDFPITDESTNEKRP